MTLMSPQEHHCVLMVVRCFFILLLLAIKTMEQMPVLSWSLGILLCIIPLGLHHTTPPWPTGRLWFPVCWGTSTLPKGHSCWRGPEPESRLPNSRPTILLIFLGLGSVLSQHCPQRDQRLPQPHLKQRNEFIPKSPSRDHREMRPWWDGWAGLFRFVRR